MSASRRPLVVELAQQRARSLDLTVSRFRCATFDEDAASCVISHVGNASCTHQHGYCRLAAGRVSSAVHAAVQLRNFSAATNKSCVPDNPVNPVTLVACPSEKPQAAKVHLVASLAVYSKLKTISSLLHNLNAFVGCSVALHLNNGSALTVGEVQTLLEHPGLRMSSRINPLRLQMRTAHHSSPNSLVDIHLANFVFAESEFGSMTHFMLMGEDERFIRTGLIKCVRP